MLIATYWSISSTPIHQDFMYCLYNIIQRDHNNYELQKQWGFYSSLTFISNIFVRRNFDIALWPTYYFINVDYYDFVDSECNFTIIYSNMQCATFDTNI